MAVLSEVSRKLAIAECCPRHSSPLRGILMRPCGEQRKRYQYHSLLRILSLLRRLPRLVEVQVSVAKRHGHPSSIADSGVQEAGAEAGGSGRGEEREQTRGSVVANGCCVYLKRK